MTTPVLKSEKRQLKCILTDTELKDMGLQLAEYQSKRKGKEDQLASVQSMIKADIKALDGNINALAEKMRNGYEYRETVVNVSLDMTAGYCAVRADTGEIIEQRPLKDEEAHQLGLE